MQRHAWSNRTNRDFSLPSRLPRILAWQADASVGWPQISWTLSLDHRGEGLRNAGWEASLWHDDWISARWGSHRNWPIDKQPANWDKNQVWDYWRKNKSPEPGPWARTIQKRDATGERQTFCNHLPWRSPYWRVPEDLNGVTASQWDLQDRIRERRKA
jgi:hypothetical protein